MASEHRGHFLPSVWVSAPQPPGSLDFGDPQGSPCRPHSSLGSWLQLPWSHQAWTLLGTGPHFLIGNAGLLEEWLLHTHPQSPH